MEWLSFNFVDILDILLFSVLLYYLFKALRKGAIARFSSVSSPS